MYYTSTYYTIASEQAEYAKRIREFEKQYAYERAIVCSVPVSDITPETTSVTVPDKENPG